MKISALEVWKSSALQQKESNVKRLLTPREVAERFAVSGATVRNWIKTGAIDGVHVGGTFRVKPESVEALLNAKEHAPA